MKSAALLLSSFAISRVAAAGDFFPLPPSELPYNDDRGNEVTVNCPLSCWNNAKCVATGVVGEGFQTNTEWSCDCPDGFHGDLCDQQDDDDDDDDNDPLCGEDSCKHGSKCIPIGENEHMCDCTPAYTNSTFYAGRYCEYPSSIFCTEEDHQEGRQFCVNEGKCGALDHSPCSCPQGFAGPRCATRIDDDSTAAASYSECSLQCSNDGTCHKGEKGMESYGKFAVEVSHLIQETHINFEHCVCPLGYFGVKCDYEFEECGQEGEHMCLNGGSCEVAQDGSHRCACIDGYYGNGCEFEILTEQEPAQKHSFLGTIRYGICAVFVVAIATVLYERKRGKDDELEGSTTVSKVGKASHVV